MSAWCGRVRVGADDQGESWHILPGGGQEKFETLEAALKRECLEEAGQEVQVGELLFVREYLGSHHEFAAKDGHVHQVEFMFRCKLSGARRPLFASVPDNEQVGAAWVKLSELARVELYPKALAGHLAALDAGKPAPRYWGDVN